ncbi:MAG: organic solvent transporter substrate-binding protein [Marmoricola sp.]|nr:organic solvent transporter substrate-binding protein [Marmoricola sp.]
MSAVVRQLRSHNKSIRVGGVTIVALLLLLTFAVTARNGVPNYVPGIQRKSLDATFANVTALSTGDDVRIADVRTGYVTSISLRDGLPVVGMELNGSPKIYANATATIRAQSGLGEKYIDINPGTQSAGLLAAGQGIAESRTQSSTDINDVLDALDTTTRAQTKSTLQQVGGGLDGRGQDLNAGLAALPGDLSAISAVSSALSNNNGADLASVLRAANDLSGNLESQQGALAQLTRDTATTLGAVGAANGRPLDHLLQSAPAGLSALHSAFVSLHAPLSALSNAGRVLQPGAAKLAAATPNLRGFLRESVPVLAEVPGFADQAIPALDNLTPTIRTVTPLVAQLASALLDAIGPLANLAGFRFDIMNFFARAADALHMGDASGHWLRLEVVPGTEMVTGNVPGLRDPLVRRQAYPAPGAADTHRTNR